MQGSVLSKEAWALLSRGTEHGELSTVNLRQVRTAQGRSELTIGAACGGFKVATCLLSGAESDPDRLRLARQPRADPDRREHDRGPPVVERQRLPPHPLVFFRPRGARDRRQHLSAPRRDA